MMYKSIIYDSICTAPSLEQKTNITDVLATNNICPLTLSLHLFLKKNAEIIYNIYIHIDKIIVKIFWKISILKLNNQCNNIVCYPLVQLIINI